MILSQVDLRAEVKKKRIRFDPPLEEDQWGEASVDLRLGFSFTRLKDLQGLKVSIAHGLQALSAAKFWDTMVLKERDAFGKPQSFPLAPKEFVLAMTYESVAIPDNLIALVEGRSSYARLGLSMHQTAPWIQPGWVGPIVLEIMNNGPLTVELCPKLDRPCQLTFFELKSKLPKALTYGSRASDVFQKQKHPLDHEKAKAAKAKSKSRAKRK